MAVINTVSLYAGAFVTVGHLKRRHDIQQNDAQHNDTQHNNDYHKKSHGTGLVTNYIKTVFVKIIIILLKKF